MLPAGVWCAVPVFNNAATIQDVVARCRRQAERVLVVDDGSTDADLTSLLAGSGATVLRHEPNLGKGAAIRTALRHAASEGATWLVVLDGDGQHDPEDLAAFVPVLAEDTDSIVIGRRDFNTPNVPGGSRFGRAFSDFWLRLETGSRVEDSQSGFRAYPVAHMARLRTTAQRYGFEVEVLARALWAGLRVKHVTVRVHYPPSEHRVSSFHPFRDNFRISCVHTRLVCRRLWPFPPRRLVRGESDTGHLLRHPARFLRRLMVENATPGGLAAAAAVGIFLATVPLISLHTVAILYVAARLNLNKVTAFSVQHLCVPPFVPFICIEVGHWLLNGKWLTEASRQTVVNEAPLRLWEWLLGSMLVAPVLSLLVAGVVFLVARAIGARLRTSHA
jgi:glycosyltransferase involved in cell wall biosynthesis